MQRLITVSNRLPVTIGADGALKRSSGGLASAMMALPEEWPQIWVGWPGQVEPRQQPSLTSRLREEQGCVPVWLTDEETAGFYAGYANATLWPILHYETNRTSFEPEWFEIYRQANARFAQAILEIARPGDTVWVHDYHLMLLPQMLRDSGVDLKIGFFLHVPFPSYEIFRCLPEREALLEGLLGADLIGFHTFGYLRHFRSALMRVLGEDPGTDALLRGRWVMRLAVHPIGHHRVGFEEAIEDPAFEGHLARLEEEFEGRRMVLSVERLDYTKGIPQKLAAIERFLQQNPKRREDTVFLILAVPSRQEVQAYQDLAEDVQRSISEINGRYSSFSRQPIHFYHRGTDPVRLAALYAFAEVALVTPLIDGMNLVAKEYVDCKGAPRARHGVLILSETAGAAQELAEATLINPRDTQGVADAIVEALALDPDEARANLEPMRQRVRRRDARVWAKRFIDDLNSAVEVPVEARVTPPPPGLIEELAAARKLALFLDYDGTLRAFTPRPNQATPSPQLLELLRRLATLPGCEVALVSGRPNAFLEQHFGALPLTLISEHGYRLKPPGQGWELLHSQVDLSWRESVLSILEHYADLTPGATVEAKLSALVWHYRRADPEYGAWKANELLGTLTEVVANLPVSVNHGHRIVEVSSQQVSKGEALRVLAARWGADRALACGDDRTDETMFEQRDLMSNLATIKVGPGNTRAAWRLLNVRATTDYLQRLAEARARRAL